MKAYVLDKYGKGSSVRLADVAVPPLGARDVLVRIHASGVNQLDNKIVLGEFKLVLPYRLPVVLGNDFAGVVERVGPEVRRFAPGDRVYARPDTNRIGTYAEYIAVDQSDLARMPAALTMAEAASLPLVALTAWQALVEIADLRPGQTVLVHAGSGGVGTIAIQLAKHLGAHVVTTTSTPNVDWVRDLGADRVIDYRTTDVDTELGRDGGVDVVLDSLGPESVLGSLRVVRPGGLVIGIAGPPDPDFAAELGKPLLRPVMGLLSRKVRNAARKRGARYSFLFMRADGGQLQEITDLVDAGAIRPVVDRVFDFDDTVAALEYVDAGRTKGKVVVTMG